MSKSSPRNAHDRALNRISKVVAKYGGASVMPGDAIVTVLEDLRHFCEEKNLDFEILNKLAARNYQRETLFAD